MEYNIAIPSYKRESVLNENTLKYLNDVGVDSDKINVFVANKSEEERYKEILNENCYNEIVVGKLGIGNQRTFIRNYYEVGSKLIMLDDDLEIKSLDRVGQLEKLKNFDKLTKISFKLMKKYKTGLVGVHSSGASMYMSNSFNVGLYFIIGFLTFEKNNPKIFSLLEASEDYESSLKAYQEYGSVIRLNNVTAKNYSRNKRTGMVSAVNTNVNFKTKEKLLKRYPKLIKKNYKRKYNTFEIEMMKMPNNRKIKIKNDIFN